MRQAVLEEGERAEPGGIRPCLLPPQQKAAYGSRVRSLNSMDHAGSDAGGGRWEGCHYYRFADLYDTITLEDVQTFLTRCVQEQYAAMSVVKPKEGTV